MSFAAPPYCRRPYSVSARCRPLVMAAGCLVAASLLTSSAAFADDEAKAASLAREAEKLISSGNYAEACPKLAESQKLDARGGTALDLAVCREKEGKIGSAYRAYRVAIELAKQEKRFDRSRSAQLARNKLYLRVPRLTVRVDKGKAPAGLTITVNGEAVPESEWNKPYLVDPGSLALAASAPGKKTWESTIDIGIAKRKTADVPALEDGPAVAAVPAGDDDDDEPTPTPVPSDSSDGSGSDDSGDDDDDDDDSNDAGGSSDSSDHATLRPVIELGVMGGLLVSAFDRGGSEELSGASYLLGSNSGGQFFATCGDTISFPGTGTCDAELATMLGGVVGGTLFGGVSLDPRVHVGGRLFGGVRFPDGFWLAGGPSASFRIAGPVWLGATVLFGAEEHTADIKTARGSVPPDLQAINGGEFVDIPVGNAVGSDIPDVTEAAVASGFLIGGSLELSLALLGPSPHAIASTGRHDFLDGSLMVSLHPAFMIGGDGMIISVPASLGYRFH